MPNSSNSHQSKGQPTDRRTFLQSAAAAAALTAMPGWAQAHPDDFSAIRGEIEKRHDEAVKRLQTWIRQPSIAAENRGMNEGCELMMEMLREAGVRGGAGVTLPRLRHGMDQVSFSRSLPLTVHRPKHERAA